MIRELTNLLLLHIGVEVRYRCDHLLLAPIVEHHLVTCIPTRTIQHIDWYAAVLMMHGVT